MSVTSEPVGAAPSASREFWGAVREALRGSDQDYTRGPLGRAVLLLAVPMVLEMALESVFAVTDIFFVSHLGPDATATVALTESLLVLVYALAMGIGVAATALVARRTGEHDPEGAAQAAGQAVLVAAGTALVLGAAGAALAPQLLALMGADAEVLAVGVDYARVMLGGEASIILLFVGNAIFRGAGDPVVAMRTLWIANAINIVLGPLLIYGPGPLPALGVTGAAVATTIGRSTGAGVALWQLGRTPPAGSRATRVQIRAADLRPDRAVLPRSPGSRRPRRCSRSSARPAGSAWCASWRSSAARCSRATRSPSAWWSSHSCRRGGSRTRRRRWSASRSGPRTPTAPSAPCGRRPTTTPRSSAPSGCSSSRRPGR
jgi:hypothetical protein